MLGYLPNILAGVIIVVGGFFAFRKQPPWLQINLLTAFAAAAVDGAFEGLIAEVTG